MQKEPGSMATSDQHSVFSCRVDDHVIIVIAIQIFIDLSQACLIPRPHPIQIASRTVILKVICTGIGFGSGTETSPKLLGHSTKQSYLLMGTSRNFDYECELCTYFLPIGKIGGRTC